MEDLGPVPAGQVLNGQADLIEAITEAFRDGDDRAIRRLLTRFAELATIGALYALRDALDTARTGLTAPAFAARGTTRRRGQRQQPRRGPREDRADRRRPDPGIVPC